MVIDNLLFIDMGDQNVPIGTKCTSFTFLIESAVYTRQIT